MALTNKVKTNKMAVKSYTAQSGDYNIEIANYIVDTLGEVRCIYNGRITKEGVSATFGFGDLYSAMNDNSQFNLPMNINVAPISESTAITAIINEVIADLCETTNN
jgi:hypothetical protein